MDTMDHEATRSFYDRISGVYDAIADAAEHGCRERGLELLAVRPGERALEVGYGTGHALLTLAQAVGPTGHVAGIDISGGMRRVAETRVAEAGLGDRVELRTSAAPPLPWDDAAFDVAFMSFTLELFPLGTIPELLIELSRVLRPGGRLGVVAMSEPGGEERGTAMTLAYKWLHRHFPHIVDCRPIDAEGFLERAGFEIRSAETMTIFALPVAILVGAKTGAAASAPAGTFR